jgi:signal transduction histidine kinase
MKLKGKLLDLCLDLDQMQSLSSELSNYLDSNLSRIHEKWQENILLYQKEAHISTVTNNALLMYELVRKNINGSLSEEDIKYLAGKVAIERSEIKSNFGEFIFNVNLGRSLLIKYINQSGLPIEFLHSIIDKLNLQFDLFCYHAVSKYSSLKEEELQEKTLLVNQNHKDSLTILGQMSSSFVHEFRNPLTAVIGFTKLLKSEDDPQQHSKYLEIIDHELDELKFRITQFLHTSKVETMQKEKEHVSIQLIFNNLLSFIYPSIVDADVNIQTSIDSDIFIDVHKDELKQVLLNILFNSIDAVKQIDDQRRISITCIRENGLLVLTISNNGPNIPASKIKSIFEPFYTTKDIGTGIGLYVCKKIIEKHNGTIYCESDLKLTSFIICLPI